MTLTLALSCIAAQLALIALLELSKKRGGSMSRVWSPAPKYSGQGHFSRLDNLG